MTRDEAITKFMTTAKRHAVTITMAGEMIDAYVALGMLKLDEPKSANERAVDAMFGHPQCSMSGLLTPRWAMEALDRAGLRVIEK